MEIGFELIKPFVAGLLTTASPCVFPMIPIYLAILTGGEKSKRSRLWGALLFSAGFSVVFVLLGLGASSLGEALNDHRRILLIGGGVFIVLLGLKFMQFLRIPFLDKQLTLLSGSQFVKWRILNNFLLGVVFAVGWTPCVGPVLGVILTYTATQTSSPLVGAFYLGSYSVGVSIPFILVALLYGRLEDKIKALNRYLPYVEKATGILLVVLGMTILGAGLKMAPAGQTVKLGDVFLDNGAVKLEPPLGHKTEKPRLAVFFSEGCHVCKVMKPVVAKLEEDCRDHKIDILHIDVLGQGNNSVARDLNIYGVPTFIFFGNDGKEKFRLIGKVSLQDMRKSASVLIGMNCDVEGMNKDDILKSIFSDECENGLMECLRPRESF